jgi:hypothetical protein
MNLEEFVASHFDVSSAQHGDQAVYVGRDQKMQWWVYWIGRADCLDANTSEEAEAAAHLHIDVEDLCQIQLNWLQVPGTKSEQIEAPA